MNIVLSESDTFQKLQKLCCSPGFPQAIAYLSFRDNMLLTLESITGLDLATHYGYEPLLRNEILILIGQMVKSQLDFDIPSEEEFKRYINESDALLNELHECINQDAIKHLFVKPPPSSKPESNPFKKGDVLREVIFYSSESAYNFQYLEFSRLKYLSDDEWLQKNKGYSANELVEVVEAIQFHQKQKIQELAQGLQDRITANIFLEMFTFSIKDIEKLCEVQASVIKKVIDSFTYDETTKNSGFNSLDDFNQTKAYPIIKVSDTKYVLYQCYNLLEAIYETPFFWFLDDKSYSSIAAENRGVFTENHTKQMLSRVFGEENVYSNVFLKSSGGEILGEIDVLIIYANRVIIFQAKSKKLTIGARKGNDNLLKNDFKKAIQDAYDQCFSCANLLTQENIKIETKEGGEINFNSELKEIYPVCVVSDHYPGLGFQAMQFLKFQSTDIIKNPYVIDLFFLDVMTEMLETPLHFLSYLNRRVTYWGIVHSTTEIPVLSYHLTNNLWVENDTGMFQIAEDCGAPLDVAMMSRRDNANGLKTPEGILTKNKNTFYSNYIQLIESQKLEGAIALGFFLLTLGQEGIDEFNLKISELLSLCKLDNSGHDCTFLYSNPSAGITVHCNNLEKTHALEELINHCRLRKYLSKSDSWYGICIHPEDGSYKFAVTADFKWKFDQQLEDHGNRLLARNSKRVENLPKKQKPGRNDPCICGSGKKYKKCCLNRTTD